MMAIQSIHTLYEQCFNKRSPSLMAITNSPSNTGEASSISPSPEVSNIGVNQGHESGVSPQHEIALGVAELNIHTLASITLQVGRRKTISVLGYQRVYLALHKVKATPFHVQGVRHLYSQLFLWNATRCYLSFEARISNAISIFKMTKHT